jgi:hypothetical protein
MNDRITSKNIFKFICKCCDFGCSKKGDWSRHILTSKHKNNDKTMTNEDKITSITSYLFQCGCGKIYKHRQGLWSHKKTCQKFTKKSDTNENESKSNFDCVNDTSNNVIIELLKQNSEFKELLIDQHKQHIESNKQMVEKIVDLAGKTGSYNTNCNNKTFNLQVFLNEQCKDALNITDFVSQIKLQLSDLDMIGRVGYTEGMSKIIVRNLKELDVSKRPIHCSDLKREILYVKDQNAWEKENGENVKIKRAIKFIESKNVKQIPQWVEVNPDSEDYDSKKHLEYHNIMIESMGGSTNEDDNKKHERIIRNIAKEVIIDKVTI